MPKSVDPTKCRSSLTRARNWGCVVVVAMLEVNNDGNSGREAGERRRASALRRIRKETRSLGRMNLTGPPRRWQRPMPSSTKIKQLRSHGVLATYVGTATDLDAFEIVAARFAVNRCNASQP